MQALGAPMRIGMVALLLVAIAGATPARVDAACGGGGLDQTWLARYAGRHADTIILGWLIERDAYEFHFELIKVYRGGAPSSPIENAFDPDAGWTGIVDVGGCSGQSVQSGELFVYATGDRRRNGPMQLIFPRVPHHGWIIDHRIEYATLDQLLVLLGVLPPTSTVADETANQSADGIGLGGSAAVLIGLTWLAYWGIGKRRRAS